MYLRHKVIWLCDAYRSYLALLCVASRAKVSLRALGPHSSQRPVTVITLPSARVTYLTSPKFHDRLEAAVMNARAGEAEGIGLQAILFFWLRGDVNLPFLRCFDGDLRRLWRLSRIRV